MSKPIHIVHSTYTMELQDEDNAEIVMYGQIVSERPRHWQTDEPLEGDYIVQKEFMKDLELVSGAKAVTIRMHSLGGDAGVSILIHNRLRELAAKGTKLTCIVDGVAMSGGSLIMSACDHVKVNPSSLVMIHKCWGYLWGGYNADDLRHMANEFDAWDKAQISIYKRKCGLSETVISHMMGNTTNMTGAEAVEKGFADQLLEDAEPLEITSSADGRCLMVHGRRFHLTPGMFAPDNIPTVKPESQTPVVTNTGTPATTGSQEGGNTLMAKTAEDLRKEYPELTAQIEAEAKATAVPGAGAMSAAVQAERKRLQEIDQVAALFSEELVQEAKYGEKVCSAQELTYRAAMSAAQQGKKFLSALEQDNDESGVQSVHAAGDPGEPPAGTGTPEQRMAAARAEIQALFGKEEK